MTLDATAPTERDTRWTAPGAASYVATAPGSSDSVLVGARAAGVHRRRVARALFVMVVVFLGPLVAPRTAQPASRDALTAAIVDHGTVDLGRYRSMLGIDHAIYEGHLRSDKGPGQPALAAPFYAAARLVGVPAVSAESPVRGDLMLWWLTLWSAVVPFALLGALVYRRCARAAPRTALVATFAIMGGSIALPHAVNLYAHALSALLGYAAYSLIADRVATRASMFFVGLLAAAAVATEYHLVIVAVVVAALAARRNARLVGWCALGAAGPIAALAWYQARAFGAPWHTPFAYYAGSLGGTTHGGYSAPRWPWFYDAMLGNRGLLITSPIVLVGVAAAIGLVVVGHARRPEAVVALVVFAAYVVLVAGWSGTPWLEEPGPRYVIPAIPFLAVPLALCWSQVRGVASIAALWGGFLMVAATTTVVLVATNDTPLNAYVNRVAKHRFLPSVWSIEFGTAGIWLYAASAALAVYSLIRANSVQ